MDSKLAPHVPKGDIKGTRVKETASYVTLAGFKIVKARSAAMYARQAHTQSLIRAPPPAKIVSLVAIKLIS